MDSCLAALWPRPAISKFSHLRAGHRQNLVVRGTEHRLSGCAEVENGIDVVLRLSACPPIASSEISSSFNHRYHAYALQ